MKMILKATTKRLAALLGLVRTAAHQSAADSNCSIPALRPTVPTAAAIWRIPAHKRRRRLIGRLRGPAAQGRHLGRGHQNPTFLPVRQLSTFGSTDSPFASPAYTGDAGGCCAAGAAGHGRTTSSRFRPHCSRPVVGAIANRMAGLKGTADLRKKRISWPRERQLRVLAK